MLVLLERQWVSLFREAKDCIFIYLLA